MLHVGLDLSRKRVDVCLISSDGELVEHFRSPCDRDGLYGLTRRVGVYDEPVRGVVESRGLSRGHRPVYPVSLIGEEKRVISPISAAIVKPVTQPIPGALINNGM